MHRPAQWAAVIAAAAALAACGTPRVAGAGPGGSARAVKTLAYYAIPEKHAEQTLANCLVTAVWNNGSLTVQGVIGFKSRQPEPAVLAVTGGTGRFDGAAGTAGVSFTKNFKILTIKLK